MSKFVETLNEVLREENISMRELGKEIRIPTSTLYDLKNFNPSLKTALKIVDYFSSSIDYFEGFIDVFKCKFEKNYKVDFYENFIKEIKSQGLSIAIVSEKTQIAEASFGRWKNGVLPNYDNLLELSKFLNCSVDKLLGRKYDI